MRDIARLLDRENTELLAGRVRLATTLRAGFAAGSSRGRVVYDNLGTHAEFEDVVAAERWLGVRVRPKFLHAD